MHNVIYNGTEDAVLKQVFSDTMKELVEQDQKVVYLDADLMSSVGMLGVAKAYPDRAIDCGIQEANMIGVAAGLSVTGKIPYAHTFGSFAGRRVYDQAFLSVAYGQNNVRIIGSDPGITAAYNGGTHMPFEDVALYRAIPNSVIIDVADSTQLIETLKLTKDRHGLTYIRMTRKSYKKVYDPSSNFEIGKACVLKEGTDCAIFAAGKMVWKSLEAANQLEKEGISVSVIDVFSIKPLDTATVIEYAKKCGCVVTAENANYIGGLGSAVAETLSENLPTPMLRVGAKDVFGQVGPEDFLATQFNLTPEAVADAVKQVIKRK